MRTRNVNLPKYHTVFVEVLQYHIEAIVNKHLTKLTVTEYLLFTVYMFVWLFTVYCAHVCLVIYCLLCTCLFGVLFVQGKDSSGGDYLLVPVEGEGAVERLKRVCLQLRSCLGESRCLWRW